MKNEILPITGEAFSENEVAVFEGQYLAKMQSLSDMMKQKKKIEAEEKKLKESLKKAFDEYGIKSIENAYIKITRVAGSTSTSIDLDTMKEKEPKLYDELLADYPKTTTRADSIRFDVR